MSDARDEAVKQLDVRHTSAGPSAADADQVSVVLSIGQLVNFGELMNYSLIIYTRNPVICYNLGFLSTPKLTFFRLK